MEQKYYAVLMIINVGKSVWLVPQKSGKLAWSDEISGTRAFNSYEGAKQTFGFIGLYKIIEFTHQELSDFEMLTDN